MNQDNKLNSQDAPAVPGQVIQIYATGVNLPPKVFFGFTQVEVTYTGASDQFPGLWQVNVRIPPSDALAMHGQFPIFLVSGGNASNAVTLWIQ